MKLKVQGKSQWWYVFEYRCFQSKKKKNYKILNVCSQNVLSVVSMTLIGNLLYFSEMNGITFSS